MKLYTGGAGTESMWGVQVGRGSGSGVMVWAGIRYGQRTQLHYIDGNLNEQRYCDEILRPIVVPFIRGHHLMSQHDNPRPHVARICKQFLEAANVPVLPWPAYSDRTPIEQRSGYSGSSCTTVCSSSWQYPATSHCHWRGVGHRSTNSLINSMGRRWVVLHEAAPTFV